jgi:N-acetylneuraminic acid mutarotase
VLAATVLSTCARQEPGSHLSARYPQAAERILGGRGFLRTARGFAPADAAADAGIDPVEASLARRGGLMLELPENGARAAAMTLPGGLTVEVRERGLVGSGQQVGGAIAYPRADGTSYWMATGDGFEEWVEVEDAGETAVAAWEVTGATLRQDGDAVLVVDVDGTARARVTAPQAYEAGGAEARAWLRVEGHALALFTDARGPALVDPMWTAVGAMAARRSDHTATLLPSGKVLVAGGRAGGVPTATAELYDPATGTWSATDSLTFARSRHTATLLTNGKVLVAAGSGSGSVYLASAELYDPVSGTWTDTGSLTTARDSHTATLMPSGRVLVVGGTNASYALTAETYDPATEDWSDAGTLPFGRHSHTATLLPNGQVLIVGGYGSGTYQATAQLYDPPTATFAGTGSLAIGRIRHTATLLTNGKVLVAGGYNASTPYLSAAQLYDPSTGSWGSAHSLTTARYVHTATLLPDGKVLVAGGYGTGQHLAGTELYDPATDSWSDAGALTTPRDRHTAILLPSGKVLVAGGASFSMYGSDLASAELFDPTARGTWLGAASPPMSRVGMTATLLTSGKVLVAGGHDGTSGATLASADLYDPPAGTWDATGPLVTAREYHAATILASGEVLVVGGFDASGALASAELYDPATGNWGETQPLAAARYHHTATLLASGKVLVAGGYGASGYVAGAELYDPSTGTWTDAGSLVPAREWHTATLLSSGQVLVAGGYSTSGYLASAQLFDPPTGAWSDTGLLVNGRGSHRATLLPSGKVLVTGGHGLVDQLMSAELYDPATGSWSFTSSLATRRESHTATLLPSGTVLVAGGYYGGPGSPILLSSAELYEPATGAWTSAGSLAGARGGHTETLLPSGLVLVTAGFTDTAELYEEGRGAQPSWTPEVTAGLHEVAPGDTLTLSGSLFTGVSEGSNGGTHSSATNHPLLQLQAPGGSLTNVPATYWSANAVAATIPATLGKGPYWARVIVSAVPSAAWLVRVALPLAVSPPSATVAPRQSQTFTASGGSDTGYVWSLATNASGGTIDAATGEYMAGSTGSVTDVVRVTDSLGHTASASITVTAGVSIAPATATVTPRAGQTFTASGGSGDGFVWSLATNASGGTIDSTGAYTAGSTGSVIDVVQVTDSLGNTATAGVTVTAGASITPATATLAPRGSQELTAAGGSGAGFVWSLATNASGGTIDSTGVYTAGSTGSATDVVRVTDSLGNTATVNVTVTAGVSISPATATLAPRASRTFTAAGGSDAGFVWSLATNDSGATIGSGSGLYTAGSTGSVTDVVRVTDSLGNTATVNVTVTAGVSTSPSTATLAPRASRTFTASGGSDAGFVWSLATNASGGTIDSASGQYTAGSTGSVTDVVHVVDSLGNAATVSVTVTAGVSITPSAVTLAPKASQTFTAAGGSQSSWAWSLAANASGATIDGATGEYTAGSIGSVTDVVRVTDSLGNTATVSVTVTAGVSITPATATLAPRDSRTFTASGGSDAELVWSFGANNSGGTIDSASGQYTAGTIGSVTDVVRVTDSLGNTATVSVTVTAGVAISPSPAALPPRAGQTFTAAGGGESGWSWALATNASGATISSDTGAYQAGPTGGVIDVVRVTDSLGNTATVNVTVTAGVSLSPSSSTLAPRATQELTAAGGSGTGYTWSLATNASGATIDAATGAYTAGSTGGVTDVVQVTDPLGNTASANITVTAGISILPPSAVLAPMGSQAFSALGGSGTGLVWSFDANTSGGTIDASGAYHAGPTGGVGDVLRVTDSLGNTATVSITVTAGVSIAPSSVTVAPRGNQELVATGGSGEGYAWSLVTNLSGATIDPVTGAYQAGSTGGVTDVVQVADSLGNTASVSVTVTAGLSISPAAVTLAPRASWTFTAAGGSASGYAWSFVANASGGTIDSGSGAYTVGAAGGVTDVVQVVDSLGNTASASITVTQGVAVTPPAATLAPRASRTFTAAGGSGTGYTWSLATNASGGTIDSTGVYTAGSTGGVSDVVRVTDSLGSIATVSITVTEGVAITPPAATLAPRASWTFTASGGSGAGFVWSLATNASGGTIDSAGGLYTAGSTGGVTDVVQVTDSLGNVATVNVTVTARVSITPATPALAPRASLTFTVGGGSGTGYSWSLATNASGATIDGSTGAYTAGATGGVTDVVRVSDSLGNVATVNVTVAAGVSITPATAAVAPRASRTFTASGGSAVGFVWSLATNASGGGIDSTGIYTAGPTGGVTDVVRATDSLGNTASVSVTVTAGLSISPAAVTLAPRASWTFAAAGGSASGYAWSFVANASGGTIDSGSGAYTVGAAGGVTDVVQVVDSLGNTASASITVTQGVAVTPPAATLAPRASRTFTAAGGSGTGYTWSLATNASGGTIDSTGVYTAGSTGGVSDVVRVTDSLGSIATVSITVTEGVAITPPAATLTPRASRTFTASGGSGAGFVWSLATNASGGTIDSASGAYTAGSTGGVTDAVQATDSLGNIATVSVTVTMGVTISPAETALAPSAAQTFTASGGSGTGYTWSLATNASGGTIDASGAYTAGSTGGVSDVVQVMDSLGNVASATVNVTAAPTDDAGGCGCGNGGGSSLFLLVLGAAAMARVRPRTSRRARAGRDP